MIRLVKKQSKQTYKDKEGNEKHYYNFFVESENGKRVQVKPAFKQDTGKLDMIAEYEK